MRLKKSLSWVDQQATRSSESYLNLARVGLKVRLVWFEQGIESYSSQFLSVRRQASESAASSFGMNP
jgi:hypothetical protein